MKTLIKNAKIVNEGEVRNGAILIEDDIIADIYIGVCPDVQCNEQIDADGCFVLPGVIDDHVHFREPGLTAKADIETESRAAAAGGVTSYFDMPNTIPQTTTIEALNSKFAIAAGKSMVNYSFFIGATNNNLDELLSVDSHTVPGVKLFMGSSTGNMLVDGDDCLDQIFSSVNLPIMAHCEDTSIINANMAAAKEKYGSDPDVKYHPMIRDERACFESTSKAVRMAEKYGARLHVAHISTRRELELFSPGSRITAEAVVGHLFFDETCYAKLGTKIKVNPAIKTKNDRDALQKALASGLVSVVGTDHAPHLMADKQGGCAKAASGMPIVQYALPLMLELVDGGVVTIQQLVQLMCHNPARIFEIRKRGFIRKGYKADITIVRPDSPWEVRKENIISKCGWSPLEGHVFRWKVERTICNGISVYANGVLANGTFGEPLKFR